MFELKIKAKTDKEIIHYAESGTLVSSKGNTIFFKKNQVIQTVKLPQKAIEKIFGWFRLSRRALRLDKCNVVPVDNNLIIVRQGNVYLYDGEKETLTQTLTLRNCRNVLHQSINKTPEGYIYFGEYGTNTKRLNVPVYRSKNRGKTWEEIYTFAPGSIKHVHGCYYDKYTDKIWVCTGDFEGENWLIVADKDFKNIKKIGDGQQKFRTCRLLFTPDEVHWVMDSPLEPSHHIIFDRTSESIKVGSRFHGPVWYLKVLTDGYYLAANSVEEPGEGIIDGKVHLYISKDLKTWEELKVFEHDGLPIGYFKYAVIGFADGDQSSKDFYMFFEAIKGYDGKSLQCELSIDKK